MAAVDLNTKSLDKKLDDIVKRILGVVKPRQIILFGSAAYGKLTPDSDLDLLVIVPAPVNRRQLEQQIYSNLRGVMLPVDVIVATETDIEKYGDKIGLIYRPALREGRVVYEA